LLAVLLRLLACACWWLCGCACWRLCCCPCWGLCCGACLLAVLLCHLVAVLLRLLALRPCGWCLGWLCLWRFRLWRLCLRRLLGERCRAWRLLLWRLRDWDLHPCCGALVWTLACLPLPRRGRGRWATVLCLWARCGWVGVSLDGAVRRFILAGGCCGLLACASVGHCVAAFQALLEGATRNAPVSPMAF
jgi:hypothetical protein